MVACYITIFGFGRRNAPEIAFRTPGALRRSKGGLAQTWQSTCRKAQRSTEPAVPA